MLKEKLEKIRAIVMSQLSEEKRALPIEQERAQEIMNAWQSGVQIEQMVLRFPDLREDELIRLAELRLNPLGKPFGGSDFTMSEYTKGVQAIARGWIGRIEKVAPEAATRLRDRLEDRLV